jgi:hypothetical protein
MRSPAGWSDREALDLLAGAERTTHVIGRPVPVMKRVRRPPLTWEAAQPGFAFPALEYVVGAAEVEAYAALRGLWGGEAGPAGVVPPLIFADEPMQCVNTLFAQTGRFHVEHAIRGLRPIPVGARIVSRCRVADRATSGSGRQFIQLECVVAMVEGEQEIPAVIVTAKVML